MLSTTEAHGPDDWITRDAAFRIAVWDGDDDAVRCALSRRSPHVLMGIKGPHFLTFIPSPTQLILHTLEQDYS